MNNEGAKVVCVRALLCCRGHLALIERRAPNELGTFYVLPGGHVEPLEELASALRRECLEELGFEVVVGSCFTHDQYTEPNGTQRIEHYFVVWLSPDPPVLPAFNPRHEDHPVSKGTYTPRWIECDNLSGLDLRPAGVWERLLHHL